VLKAVTLPVAYVPAGETAYLTFGVNDVPGAVRALREVYKNEGLERGAASHITAEQKILAAGYVKADVELRKDKLPVIGLVGKRDLVLELTSSLERVGTLRTGLIKPIFGKRSENNP